MNLQKIIDSLAPLLSAEVAPYSQEYAALLLTPEEYADALKAIENLRMADLLNHKLAQAAFPKLVNAVKLVLAVADNPDSNPEIILLSSKMRAQLEASLKAAGE
jgi:hypothetical protein